MRDNLPQKKILIVDDDKNFTQLLKIHLEIKQEYKVFVENRAKNAIHAARQFKPDLILLDILMPKLDGFSVLRALKKDSQTMPIPVVMLTSVNDEHVKIKAMEQYSDYYITKSEVTTELKKKIDEILSIHR